MNYYHYLTHTRSGIPILVFLALLLAAPLALANPAMQLTSTLTQPDGTQLEVRLWGDEFANGWETTDGYTLRFDSETRYWVYAVLDQTGGLTESNARAGIDPPVAEPHLRPTLQWLQPRFEDLGSRDGSARSLDKAAPGWASGNTNVLIIMVQFPADGGDPDGAQPAVPASFTAAQASANMFGGTSTGPGNLTDYYDEVSFGALNLIGTVVGPYTVAHDKNDYDDGPLNAKTMVAEAIALADGDVDFNDFDNDGNGWVDNVAVMYAGNGPDNGGYEGDDPDANSLWPHASNLGGPVAVDGINAQTYYIAAELLNSTPRLRTIGVYAHEFGHKLGLPDLYDTDDEPNDSAGIGHWCLMASGSWCSNNPGSENGESPSHMSAWCKSFMGWMTPTDHTGSNVGQSMPQAETNAFAVQLGSNPGGPDDWPGSGEYFLIENRQQTMFDIGLDGCGILVWHIDESLDHNRNQGHSPGMHRMVDLEEADGTNDLDGSSRGDTGDPFPGSTNNTLWDDSSNPHSQLYDGTSTDYRMKVLSAACDPDMDVTFGNQPPVAICQDVQVNADEDCLGTVTAAMVDNGSNDPDGDPITLALNPPGPYALGVTNVTLTVTDDKGESDSCNAMITVIDVTPPMVTCPANLEIECTEPGGVAANDPQLVNFFDAFMAEDNCDDNLDIVNDAPAFFAGPCEANSGVTTVTWIATDDAGNSNQCSADVTVVDTTAPEIEVTVAPQVLWPPNHKMVEVEYTVTVSDICDDDPQWVLVGVTSNEPDDDNGDGHHEPDIQDADAGTADNMVSLRAERDGRGDGRVYTATFEVTDCSGNSSMAESNVYVPHSKNDIAGILSSSGPATGSDEISYMVSGASIWGDVVPVEIDGEIGGNEILRSLDPRSAIITNTAGYVVPSAFYLKDVDFDNRKDVLVAFDLSALEDLRARSDELDGVPVMALEIGQERFIIIEMIEIPRSDVDLDDVIADLRNDGDTGDILVQDEREIVVVRQAGLIGAAPNPFNPATTISYYIPDSRHVELAIFDISGRRVARLVSQTMAAGEHSVMWHGTDTRGSKVASGVYFYQITAGRLVETKRMILVK